MNRHRVFLFLFLLSFVVGCAPQEPAAPAEPPDTRAQDEMAIRDTAKQWAAAAQAKDAEKFVSFYTEDATLLLPNSAPVSGRAALLEAVSGMMKDPAFALSFETSKVEVAKSGDLAVELGSYSLMSTDPKTKKPNTEKGNGIVVWKKQADGSWKAHFDVPVAGPADATPAQK